MARLGGHGGAGAPGKDLCGLGGVGGWSVVLVHGSGSGRLLDVLGSIPLGARAAERKAVDLPKEVKKELLAAARLSFLFYVSLEAEFVPHLYMLDASPTGGAVIKAPAGVPRLRHESRYAYRHGSITMSEADLALTGELSAGSASLEAEQEDGERPFYRVPLIGSGPGYEGHVDAVRVPFSGLGIRVSVEVADQALFPGVNFSVEKERDRLLLRARTGAFDAVISMVPAETWDTVDGPGGWKGAEYVKGSSSVLRSFAQPWGKENLRGSALTRAKQQNLRLLVSVTVAAHGAHNGRAWLLLGPMCPTGGAVWSSVEEVAALSKKATAGRVDQCGWGAVQQQSRWMISNLAGAEDLLRTCACSASHKKAKVAGLVPDKTREPVGFWEEVARLLALDASVRANAQELRRSEQVAALGDFEVSAAVVPGTRVRAPPLGKFWSDPAAFSEVFRMSWQRLEPTNMLETVTVVACVRHVCRNPDNWGKTVLIATDNLCALAVVANGRSSAYRLLLLTRKAGALAVASGVKILLRWVKSASTWADGPSRAKGIGYWDQDRGILVYKRLEWLASELALPVKLRSQDDLRQQVVVKVEDPEMGRIPRRSALSLAGKTPLALRE